MIQKMVTDDELRKVLLKKDYTFTHLIPLLCRITVQILLYKTISSYPTWLKTDGGHNIFYVKIVDATATLIVYLNRNKVWVICLYGAVPQKHKVGDQVFGPVIHDFVQ
jgi:hypothetical protein